jgi:hypothetical protein
VSQFDPNTFLDITTEGANSTVSVPVPAGEYIAFIEDIKARAWTSKDDPTKAGMALDIIWNIDDAGVKQLLERDKVTVKQGIMLDVTEEGGLDMGKGKNVTLGRLREATGLNNAGQPFGFKMLPGKAARIKVEHRVDPKNPEIIYAEVKAVAKVG